MGNRSSIEVFCPETKEVSVVLFRRWGGDTESMVRLCKRTKKNFVKNRALPPFNQVEEIIAWLTYESVEELGTSAYLGKNEYDGVNSDNGHFVLEVHGHDKPRGWFLITPDGRRIKNE